MKVATLFSGGKDSTSALQWAIKKKHDVKCLIAIVSKNPDSFMFHTTNINLVKLQAEALNLPLISLETAGEKEIELKELKKAISIARKKYKIEAVVSGAVASNYQKTRIEKICSNLKLKSLTPLWDKDPEKILIDAIKNKFKIIITAIAAYGLNEKWLGRKLDLKALKELKILNEKHGVHLSGEGGELETLVLDCPIFEKELEIKKSKILMEDECSGKFLIEKIKLKRK